MRRALLVWGSLWMAAALAAPRAAMAADIEGAAKAGQSASEFARAVQRAVQTRDYAWLAEHARFPLRVRGRQRLTVANAKTFIVLGRNILQPELVASVLAQNPDRLASRDADHVIGASSLIAFGRASAGESDRPDWRIVVIED